MQVFIIGGVDETKNNLEVDIFDPKDYSLTVFPDSSIIKPAHYVGLVQFKDKILVLGGKSRGTWLTYDPGPVREFDPKTGNWRETGLQTPLPEDLYIVKMYNN